MKFHLRKPIPWFQIMKITFTPILIVMLLTGMAYSSALNAQDILNKKVNLSVQNVSLADAIKGLQKSSDIKFIYSKNAINVQQKISIDAVDLPLKDVLDQILKPIGIDYEVLKDRIVLGKSSAPIVPVPPPPLMENKTKKKTKAKFDVAGTPVSGKVLDAQGQPVIGASIIEKGTTNGVTTGMDGTFKLSVTGSNSVLVVAFVGYKKQEITVGNQTVFNFTLLEDVTGLSEIVVIGYGTQKKSVTTGAISGVTSKQFEDQPVTRLEAILQGRTSGLTIAQSDGQPGSGATVRVRGITTFGAGNDPLWVVDGVVVDNGGIGYLNQSDIESIEVLKDAASQAIYGTRAATGVILVTTKKGKAGNTAINYSGYAGVSGPARKVDLLNATQYATLRNESSVAGGGSIIYANPSALGTGTDWQSLIFNDSAQKQNHELSVSGGNEKVTYYTSFGYLQQDGIVATDISKYKRANFRTNETFKPAKWLSFGNNIGYSYERNIGLGNTNSEFGGPLSSALNLDPMTPAVVTDPVAASAPIYANNPVRRNPQGYPYGISTIVTQEITNPLAYITTRLGNYSWAHNVVANGFLEVEPIKGLKIKSTLGTKTAFYGFESFTPVFYLNTSSNNSQNNYTREDNRLFNWNVENTATYNRTIGKHTFEILAGQGAYSENNFYKVGVTEYNLPVDNFADASLNFSVPANLRVGYGSENQEHHLSSLFARLSYDYDEKYLLQAILRRDGSSRFGDNFKYGNFPSISVGWVATKESFFPKNNAVSFLKIRGSYGVVGNDNFAENAFLSTIGGGRSYSFGTSDSFISGFSPNAPSNPNLHWEQTSQLNFGFDAVIYNDLNLTFEVFDKKTSGILYAPQIPFYVGAISNPFANIGDMENTGQELELGYHKKIGKLNLGLTGNISHIKNNVTFISNGVQTIGGQGFQNIQGGVTQTAVGQPFGSFYGYQEMGIFQSQAEVNSYVSSKGTVIQPNAKPGDFKWADLNGDGAITVADRTYLGSSLPTYTYGLTFNASYKNFDLLVFGAGAGGNKIFQGLHRLDIANANYTTAALGRWTGPGTSNTYPRLVDGDPNHNFTYNSDFYLESGNYFRIKTVQVGYTFPKSLVSKVSLQKARIYFNGENLFTLTKYTGYDPEIGGGSLSIDRGIYPQARAFIIGLSLGF